MYRISVASNLSPAILIKYFIFSLLLGNSALASAESALSFRGNIELLNSIPLIYSSTRLPQHITETPNAVTVIDSRMIEASGAQEIGDLLRLVPGFQVAYFQNNVSVVTSHGFVGNHNKRLQVLFDGRSVYIPLLSTVDWMNLGIGVDDIERIEVIRGSNSPSYGANAFSGVINIITKAALGAHSTEINLTGGTSNFNTLNDSIETDHILKHSDIRNAELAKSGKLGQMDYRLSLGYREDSGFLGVNDDKQLGRLFFHGNYTPSLNDVFNIELGGTYGKMGVFADPISPVFDIPRDKDINTNFQKVSWVRKLGVNKEFRTQLYHNWFQQQDRITLGSVYDVLNDYFALNTDARDALLTAAGTDSLDAVLQSIYQDRLHDTIDVSWYHGTAQRVDFETQYTHTLNPDLRYITGVGARLDRVKSLGLFADTDSRYDRALRLFGNLEWRIWRPLSTNIGLMVERNDTAGTHMSPRIGINYHFNKKHHLRATATRAYRSPSLLEKHVHLGMQFSNDYTLVDHHAFADPEVKPEKINNFEVGYVGDFRQYQTLFSVKGYVEQIRDGLAETEDTAYTEGPYVLDTQLWEWTNVTEANIRGIEFEMRYSPALRTFFTAQYSLAECYDCTYMRYIDPDKSLRDIGNTVPRHTMSLLAQRDIVPDWSIAAAYYSISGMKWMENGNEVDAYDRWDVIFGLRKKLSGLQTHTQFIVQNLLGTYNEFRRYNNFETRALLKLKVAFH